MVSYGHGIPMLALYFFITSYGLSERSFNQYQLSEDTFEEFMSGSNASSFTRQTLCAICAECSSQRMEVLSGSSGSRKLLERLVSRLQLARRPIA